MSVGDSVSLRRTGVSRNPQHHYMRRCVPPALSRFSPAALDSFTRSHAALAGTPARRRRLRRSVTSAAGGAPEPQFAPKLFAIISRKKSRRRRSDQLTVIRRRAKAPSPYHRDCSGVVLLLFSISSLVLYGAPAAGFKFSIIDSGVSGSKQIQGCCTIVLITKENPDGFSFAGSLHGCVDRTMKRP